MSETQVITAAESEQARTDRKSLVSKFADKYGLEANRMMATLKATAFKGDVSNEQMAALLIVADQHNLNPWTKEIHAFPTRGGGIVPVVGVDGWARIINEHPQFDGMDFEQNDEQCTCKMYRKDRSHPTVVTEYMKECYRPTDPWNSHPKRMLRHKAMIQCARLAFAFAGIYDPDEADRVLAAEDAIDITPAADRKLVSPVKLRKIIDSLMAAVAAKDRVALLALIQEHEMTKDLDAPRYIWSELRSWEARAINDLMANKAIPDDVDIDAWSVTALQGAKSGPDLLASYSAIEGAYADRDVEVPLDIQTLFGDLKQSLGVP